MANYISNIRARAIASQWHDSGNSALYQFASSGVFVFENALRYLKEVQGSIESEFWPFPKTLSRKDASELGSLKRWFTFKCTENGLSVTWVKHPQYGYLVPFIDGENTDKVTPLRIPV